MVLISFTSMTTILQGNKRQDKQQEFNLKRGHYEIQYSDKLACVPVALPEFFA